MKYIFILYMVIAGTTLVGCADTGGAGSRTPNTIQNSILDKNKLIRDTPIGAGSRIPGTIQNSILDKNKLIRDTPIEAAYKTDALVVGDKQGIEWARCPLQKSIEGIPIAVFDELRWKCPRFHNMGDNHFTYIEAVTQVSRLGGGWRLPNMEEWHSFRAEIMFNYGLRKEGACSEYNRNSERYLGPRSGGWTSRIYTQSDQKRANTKTIRADVAEMRCEPGAEWHDDKHIGERLRVYLVRSKEAATYITLNRTLAIVSSQGASLTRYNDEQVDQDKAALAASAERGRQYWRELIDRNSSSSSDASSVNLDTKGKSTAAGWKVVSQYEGGFAEFGLDLRARATVYVVRCGAGAEYKLYRDKRGKWGSIGLGLNNAFSTMEEAASRKCN